MQKSRSEMSGSAGGVVLSQLNDLLPIVLRAGWRWDHERGDFRDANGRLIAERLQLLPMHKREVRHA